MSLQTSKTKPHIVHLTTVHRPFDTRIFQKECRTLAKVGYHVSLIAPHTRAETVDGVGLIPVPQFNSRPTRMTRGIWAVYRLARDLHADIYHFHDPELMPVGNLLKLTTDARVVYDVHEDHRAKMQSKDWLAGPLSNLASWGVAIGESISGRLADAVVTATDHIARHFPAAKTRVIRNYPLLNVTDASALSQRVHEGNFTLIYTGGFTDHRGIYEIIQSLEYVETPQARLTLLGRNLHPHVAQAARLLPGYQRVDYLGHLPYETMFEHLNSAAVGLICNQPRYGYDLALPNKLFEYMSAGLPVIASHYDQWKEIVEGNECGVTVDPTRPQDIARAVDFMLRHPDLRHEMGRNGRRAVEEKYNWEREAEKLVLLYQSLAEVA